MAWYLRLIAAGLALADPLAVLDQTTAHAMEVVVRIENFTFNPAELTVKPGTTVVFENADDIPHSIVEKNGKFRSTPLDTGDHFAMSFVAPGEVDYYCGFHPHMVGKVLIKP